ncbi:hypothetical protein [Terriglobus roseus]|uniref:Uncharacterized protein n=1 Tax=Terriglobus roseus TaxID=392734 RepID=A0A1G7GC97_9BACT|nr:hypothetical protein [Terriglobus roseus]SDE85762.1 hypothetical protein SAMN05444167_0645 [Terriglobus roseus]
MEVSKLKVELYDVAAILLPGVFFIMEIWATLFGMHSVVTTVKGLKGTELTVMLLCSFGVGNLVQEAGNVLFTRTMGKRFFYAARDEFWSSHEAELVRSKIEREGSCKLADVDSAFEYCLTRVAGKFPKRDVFMAISDFSRSLFVLSLFAIFPLYRSVLYAYGTEVRVRISVAYACLVLLTAWLSWTRMLRFRKYSDRPVFTTFLACGEEGGDNS